MTISTPRRHARSASESRTLRLEPLEDRRLLTALPWHNATIPTDVNGSGKLTPTDAVAVISDLLVNGARAVPDDAGTPLFYVDTNGDNMVTPRDALLVIRHLLSPPTATLSTLVPFSIDRTPIITVAATSEAELNDTPVTVDVDLNNDGDFSDEAEMGYSQAVVYNGSARLTLPELPAPPPSGTYSIRLRARFTDPDGISAVSPVEPLIIDTAMSTALSDYVHAADASYQYTLDRTVDHTDSALGPYMYYALKMTSQTWRSETDVNKPLWQHWVDVIVPAGELQTTALLFITGGNNNLGDAPTDADAALVQVAEATGSVVVVLHTVPNEPVIFTDETGNRSEDEIIAYTFNQYMQHLGEPGNETWPLLVAMAKAAVRAMDTAQDFVPQVADVEINDFVVTGYSKRGWTTWLTAAVDDRVRGIIPGVFDNPDQGPQMVHHYEVYGFFSEAVQDYNDLQIFDRIMTPEGQQLSRIVDPYRYFNNGRFEIPKLILNSAGDEFFVSDSAQFYFHDLPGQDNYLRYFPNTGHGLDASAITSTITFYYAILNGSPLPKFSWTIEPDGAIDAETVDTPIEVRMWQATNPTARDFRHAFHPEITWESTVLTAENGVYIADPPMPDSGATAYFIEFTYPSDLPGMPYKFTTEIWVKSTLPLYDWPFESGFPDPLVATAEAAVASGLSIQAVATPAAEPSAVPLAAIIDSAIAVAASPAAAAASVEQAADNIAGELGADPEGTDALLADSLFADAAFERELEALTA